MSAPVHSYGRVRVSEGKHGLGDYKVEFNSGSPTHGELLTILWWIFAAEDRYVRGVGRRMLWWLIKECVYKNGMTLDEVQRNADGKEAAA